MPDAGRLGGRRALITGASRGIGRAIAAAAHAEGAACAFLGRGAEPDHGIAVHADLADPVAVTAAVEEAARRLGGLDAVVCAAGIDCAWAPTGEMDIAEWDRTIAVNLSGTFYVCRAALPRLVAAGDGAIVNVTSVAGLRAWPEDVAYNASKAGIEMLTRTIAVEYGPAGIRANCVAPGVIDAGMTDSITSPAERERMVAQHPLGRLGRADEVAEAVVWLLSGAAGFTTGTTLTVDGGFLA
jgi:NAD(P)-dependent dehydrogenase (short-subunit alcohol dehydrogenase family)